MEKPTELELARFFSYIEKKENGCWIWTGAKIRPESKSGRKHKVSGGYGLFTWRGKVYRVHRLYWKWVNGELPEGITLDHTCHTNDNTCIGGDSCPHRACVNPEHLKPMSRKENVLSGNTITAENAQKTHCKNGHELMGYNIIPNKAGKRVCRTCNVERTKQWRKMQKLKEHGQ